MLAPADATPHNSDTPHADPVRQAKELKLLFDAAKVVLESNDFAHTARYIFDAACELTGAKSGYVALLSDDGAENELLFLEAGGLPCTVDPELPMPIRGLRAESYRTGRAVCDNDFMNSEWIQYMPAGHCVLRNVLFAPLVVDGKTIGILGLANKDGDFDNNDLRISEAFGQLAAIALKNSRTLEALQASRQHLALVIKGSGDAPWDWDLKAKTLHYSDQWWAQLGYGPGELPADEMLWKRLVHPEDVSRVMAAFGAALEDGTESYAIEFRLRHKQGHYVPVLSRGVISREEDGTPARVTGTNLDLTEQKRSSEEAMRLKTAIDQVPVGIALASSDYELYYCNPAGLGLRGSDATQLTHIPKDAYQNWQVLRVDGTPYPVDELPLVRAIRDGVEVREEFIVRHSDGQERLCDAVAVPVLDPAGATVGGVVIFPDVSEKREMERQLRHAEKMNAIGQLAGGVAHDFNNQLAGILGYADLLQGRLQEPALKQYAAKIVTGAERSADLTKQLLAFARKGQHRYAPVQVHQVIAEVISFLQHSLDKSIEVRQRLAALPSMIMGDASQIQSALLNLALNARDAMPDGGVLEFITETVEPGSLDCTPLRAELHGVPAMRIAIRDTGTGMPPEVQERIFEPFYTTKEVGKGTGMGLASVYGTVQNHGGCICVESREGEGTTLSLCFPTVTEAKAAPSRTAGSGRVARSLRVLVVDDETMFRELAGDMLAESGHFAEEVADGAEAVAYYREHRGETDLVLLDMVMPRMGGLATFRALKEIDPEVVVIIASGYDEMGEARYALEEGAVGFLQKPFDRAALLEAIHEAGLSRWRKNDGARGR